MEQQIIFHLLGGDSRIRAEQARFIYARGIHAELYADIGEFLHRMPRSGVILASGDLLQHGVAPFVDRLGEAGIWLPLVVASEQPEVHEIVGAVKDGALDYLSLPIDHLGFDRLMARIEQGQAHDHAAARRAVVEARTRINKLSRRERQVLDWMCEGCSNKHIARELDISPRTVEIHRANMMEKIGAQHSSEAVRLQCIAGLHSTAQDRSDILPPGNAAAAIAHVSPAAAKAVHRTRAA